MEAPEQKIPTLEEIDRVMKSVAVARATNIVLSRHREELFQESKKILEEFHTEAENLMKAKPE